MLDEGSRDNLTEGVAVYPAKGTIGDKAYFKSVKENVNTFMTDHALKNVAISVTVAPFIEGIASSHIMTLQTTDKKILKKAITFEIGQQELVDNLANVQYLWTKLSEQAGDVKGELGRTEVLLTTINKSFLHDIAQLRKVRWKVSHVEVQVSTISRFVRDNAVVLDFGHQSTRIYLFKESRLKSIEVIGMGGKGVTEAIQAELETPSTDVAEELKHHVVLPYGFLNTEYPSDALKRASDVVANETNYLIGEIKRVIRTFELREALAIGAITYTGGMTNIPNFIPTLEDELEYTLIPFETLVTRDVTPAYQEDVSIDGREENNEDESDEWDEFSAMESRLKPGNGVKEEEEDEKPFGLFLKHETEEASDPPKIALFLDTIEPEETGTVPVGTRESDADEPLETDETDHQGGDMATATALAYLIETYPELNYQKFLKYSLDVTSFFIAIVSLCLTLQVGVPMVGGQYDENIETLNLNISQQSQQLSTLETDVSQLDQEKTAYTEMVARTTGLESQKKWYSDFLHRLPDKTPEGVAIEHISIFNGVITLDGHSVNYSDIGFLAMGLEEMGTVAIVEIKDNDGSQISTSAIVDTDEIHADDTMTKTFTLTFEEQGPHHLDLPTDSNE